MDDPCVVVSERAWRRAAKSGDEFGRWLVKNTPRGAPLGLPKRSGTRRGDPFTDAGV